MQGHIAEYYEQANLWEKDLCEDPHEKARITEAINVIPPDVRTVVDLGCGNGAFLNSLIVRCSGRFERVVGLDSSREALRHVKAEATQGSIAELPFEDKSFDLVTCMETLEHLSQTDFQRAVDEMQRVSRRYILLTVPNRENLTAQLVMCPECQCCFNPYLHVRSFDKARLRGLLARYEPVRIEEIGPRSKERAYSSVIYGLRLFLGRRPPPSVSICPQCGFHKMSAERQPITCVQSLRFSNPVLETFKLAINIVTPKCEASRWFLSLYRKREVNA